MEQLLFIRRFLAAPRRIGSVAPSSRFLTRAMASHLPAECRTVVELGAGTGSVTQSLLERLDTSATYLVFEQDAELREMLSRRFPTIALHGDAVSLSHVLDQSGLQSVDAVVSGLPFALMPESQRSRIVDQVWNGLRPGGRFIAFQYSRQLVHTLERRFSTVHSELVWLNLPPAFVYVAEK